MALKTVVLVACSLTIAIPALAAPPVYVVDDLELLPGTTEARGNAVNDAGAVVGQARPTGGFFQAALWPSGTNASTDLAAVIGESTSVANGINDAGRFTSVAGFPVPSQSVGGTAHFYDGATLFDLGKFGSGTPPSTLSSLGNAVNDADQVVGRAWASDAPTGYFHAFSWLGGVLTDLGTIDPCLESEALDVNNNGQIVGFGSVNCLPNIAVFWPSAGQPPLSLNALLATAGITANVVMAAGINDAGNVLAQRVASSRGRCVIFTQTPAPALVEVGSIGPNAQFQTTCLPGKINNRGEVVASQIGGGSIALLYSQGELYDLNELLEPQSAAQWELLTASDINDSGTIVGQGRINGELHAYRAIRIDGNSPCAGDCDGSDQVSIDDLITLVSVAQGDQPISTCPAGNPDSDQTISLVELLVAIDTTLTGCSS